MCNLKYKYLIVRCVELHDQDPYREIICVTNDYEPYRQLGYEIYKIKKNGSVGLIKRYNNSDYITDYNDDYDDNDCKR